MKKIFDLLKNRRILAFSITYFFLVVWFFITVVVSRLSVLDVISHPAWAFKDDPSPFILLMVLIVIPIYIYKNGTNNEEQAESKEKYAEELRKRLSVEEKDILELMIDNMGEIKEYFKISKDHAKSSFRLSVISCVIGFVILIASFIIYFVTKAIEPVIFTTISGAIVEIFAGTALLVHKSSINQLNHYYDALHNNERFLSIVNLVSKLKPEKIDELYIEIIHNEMNQLNKSPKNVEK